LGEKAMLQRISKDDHARRLDLFDHVGLSSEEFEVKRVLSRHQGKAQAIRVDVLAAIVRMPNVKVRETVRGLIVTHGVPIGSSVTAPAGYYWIVDREETEENYQRLRHRGIAVLQRAACLRKIGMRELLRELQTEIWEREDPPLLITEEEFRSGKNRGAIK
jgi:hypothetical protein